MQLFRRVVVMVVLAASMFCGSAVRPVHAIDGFVKVTSPNGGETLKVGDTYTITWDSSPNIDKVAIGYSFGPGSLNWIQFDGPNTKSYSWKVNIGNTTNTKIRIRIIAYETGKGSVEDSSDGDVTVTGGYQAPTSAPASSGTGQPAGTASGTGGSAILFPTRFAVPTARPTPTPYVPPALTYRTIGLSLFQFEGSRTTDLSKVADLSKVEHFTLDTKQGYEFMFTQTLNFTDQKTLKAIDAVSREWEMETWFVWIHAEWWITYDITTPIEVTYTNTELTGYAPQIVKMEEKSGTKLTVTPMPSVTARPTPNVIKSAPGAVVLSVSDATPVRIAPRVTLDRTGQVATDRNTYTVTGKASHANLVFSVRKNGSDTTAAPAVDAKTGSFSIPVGELVEGANYLEVSYKSPDYQTASPAGSLTVMFRPSLWTKYGTVIASVLGATVAVAAGFFGRGLLDSFRRRGK